MPRHFTQKHYVHAADAVVESTGFRHEKVANVLFLVSMFAADGLSNFDETRFIKACGFEGETVESLSEELTTAADAMEAAAAAKRRQRRLRTAR